MLKKTRKTLVKESGGLELNVKFTLRVSEVVLSHCEVKTLRFLWSFSSRCHLEHSRKIRCGTHLSGRKSYGKKYLYRNLPAGANFTAHYMRNFTHCYKQWTSLCDEQGILKTAQCAVLPCEVSEGNRSPDAVTEAAAILTAAENKSRKTSLKLTFSCISH